MTDIVIVGGGPAGLATAIAAAQHGLMVTVVDGREPPIDKACGEGLMPSGVVALARLGIDPNALDARPFRGIRYFDHDERGEPVVADASFPNSPGLGMRRPKLHEVLIVRAEDLGVSIRWRTKAKAIAVDGVETASGRIRARFIVGADGLHSGVRRHAGFLARAGRHTRRGVRRHFRVSPWSDRVEIHWADGAEAYVTPVSGSEVGVALLAGEQPMGFDRLIGEFPELGERLTGADPASEDRGAGPFHQIVRSVVRGNLALVGDAAGYLDPITGEGLGLAMRQGLALARHIKDGQPGRYEQHHGRIVAPHLRLTNFLLWLQRRPEWRRRAITALATEPALFSRILAAHNHQISWRDVVGRDVARFARALIRTA